MLLSRPAPVIFVNHTLAMLEAENGWHELKSQPEFLSWRYWLVITPLSDRLRRNAKEISYRRLCFKVMQKFIDGYHGTK